MTMRVWLSLTLREPVREILRDVCITWLVVAGATFFSSYSPEKPVKPKDSNESADEQQRATKGNNDLADKKNERKRKREKSSAGDTCKKSKVS